MTPSESEKESTKPETEPAEPDPTKPRELTSEGEEELRRKPRELTPEEREELRKKLEEVKKTDPNIYPVF